MNLAWATVVLVVLLAPGFLFFASLSVADPVRREAGPANQLAQLGGVVISAFAIQAVCYLASLALCSPGRGVSCVDLGALFATLRLESGGTAQSAGDAAAATAGLVGHPVTLLAYWLFTCVFGWLAGFAADRLVLQRWPGIGFRSHYPWLYELRQAMHSGFVEAFVLTDSGADGWVLMYRGFLDGFYAGPDGSVRQLALRYPRRFRMRVGDPPGNGDEPDASGRAHPLGTSLPLALDDAEPDDEAGEMEGFLLIGGTTVRNAYFRYFPVS